MHIIFLEYIMKLESIYPLIMTIIIWDEVAKYSRSIPTKERKGNENQGSNQKWEEAKRELTFSEKNSKRVAEHDLPLNYF